MPCKCTYLSNSFRPMDIKILKVSLTIVTLILTLLEWYLSRCEASFVRPIELLVMVSLLFFLFDTRFHCFSKFTHLHKL